MAVSADEFKGILRNYAAGVTIVTARDAGGGPVGATVSAFSSVSVDPPLVQVCLNAQSRSARAILQSRAFTVHILDDGQKALAERFASDSSDKFAGLDSATGTNGAPIILECANRLECTLFAELEAGTHLILVGRVEGLASGEMEPLIYVNRQFCGVHSLGAPA